MADPEHLEILLQGVKVWNEFVEEQPVGFSADLGKVDLWEANLEGADLRGADLREVVLRRANLAEANLRGANLWRADLRRADLRGADLQKAMLQEAVFWGANLRWADLWRANTKSAQTQAGTKNATAWFYTDLTNTRYLNQSQLDSMIGDSGTLIPERLKRPAHWPDLEVKLPSDGDTTNVHITPDTPQDSDTLRMEDNLVRLAESSPVGFETSNGKIRSADMPLGVEPPVKNAPDLQQRWAAQGRLVASIIDEARAAPSNFDVDQLVRRLERYQDVLQETPENWYEPEDAVRAIKQMMVREDAENCWPDRIVGDLMAMIQRHAEMEPLIRPKQPAPGSPDEIPPAPVAHLPEELEEGAGVEAELEAITKGDELPEIAETGVIDLFRRDLEELKEARAEHEPDKRKRWITSVLSRTGVKVAAFTSAVATGVAASVFTSNEAARTVLAHLEKLLDLLLRMFT